MEYRYIVLLATGLIIMACQNAKPAEEKKNLADAVQVESQQVYNTDLYGMWRSEGDETQNPIFIIKPDSITYIEQALTYLLKIKEDSLYIYYPGRRFKAAYKIEKEILTMRDGVDNVNRFIKVK